MEPEVEQDEVRDGDGQRELDMEWTKCLLCGSESFEGRYQLENRYTQYPSSFALVQCSHCGLVYLNPRPSMEMMADYYPATYDLITSTSEESGFLHRWLFKYGLWKRCQPLLKNRPPGKILDIGCGKGYFLAEMRRHGWKPVGVDRNPHTSAFAQDVLNIEVHSEGFEDTEFADRAFDAVTMWDSLEHLHNPYEALVEIRRILKPGGYLLLRVPSLDSLDAALFGPYWAGLDPPRHLTVFSQETLVRLLNKAGFAVQRLWCMSGSHASFAISLRLVLEQRKDTGILNHILKVFLDGLSSPIGSMISAPYFFLISELTWGPEITALSKKQEQHDR